VPKALIREAVTEAVSPEAAERIAGLKKADMASAAEALLGDSGWLPKQLRPRNVAVTTEMQQAAE
jgi:ParB family chromosome partitioning protein